jgi:Protein of unknown function (DUF4058)
MPLLDHFHPPLKGRRHWESFHARWTVGMSDALNERWLPQDYYAEVQTHNPRVEIDVATYEEAVSTASRQDRGGTATATRTSQVWTPPAPPLTLPAVFPHSFEVRVFSTIPGGPTLVGAIELLSPGNKQDLANRRAFVSKCLSYLTQGVSLVIVDIVSSRRANLHRRLMRAMKAPEQALLDEGILYAVAYRPTVRRRKNQIDLWPEHLAVGRSLPTMPLRLTGDLFVPVELEATYTEACKRLRIE